MKFKKLVISLVAIAVLYVFLYFENNCITISEHIVSSNKIPLEFDGFKIIHISDLHSKVFGKNNEILINKIKNENPDIVVITGDLIDRRRYNEEKSMTLINGLKDEIPIYYVNGNHEGWSGKFDSLEKKLINAGVVVLRNESMKIKKCSNSITIIGIDDPAFNAIQNTKENILRDIIRKELSSSIEKHDKNYKILLTHRPENFDIYTEYNIDLSLAGHAHGGQVRIPFIGGVIAPNQGYFPKYSEGIHEKSNSFMIVSRGLGNSLVPQRIWNRPEIVSIILKVK